MTEELQKEYVSNLISLFGDELKVERHYKKDDNFRYGKRKHVFEILDSKNPYFDERTLFKNELVIDLDSDTLLWIRKENEKIISFLRSQNIPYLLFHTGGRGFHIHIFFEPAHVDKRSLVEWIVSEAGVDTEKVKVDYQVLKNHLIRECGGRRIDKENGEITGYKSFVPSGSIEDAPKRPITNKSEVIFPTPDDVKVWDIDEEIRFSIFGLDKFTRKNLLERINKELGKTHIKDESARMTLFLVAISSYLTPRYRLVRHFLVIPLLEKTT